MMEKRNDTGCSRSCGNRRTAKSTDRERTGRNIDKLKALLQKDCRMMISGKFFLMAAGSLLLYTLFIRFCYLNFMEMDIYNVCLYDPAHTLTDVSPLVHPADSLEELEKFLAEDANGVSVTVKDGKPEAILYAGAEKIDRHRADYALSLLRPGRKYTPETVGYNTPEMKMRKEITCELLFIEIVAVGFLGIASLLFREKQMGVIRVHAILPLPKGLFIFSRVFLFLVTDLAFGTLMSLLNVGPAQTAKVLPDLLIQTALLSLIMALVGFGCAMLLKDFRQFSLAYLVIALLVTAPVFLTANTSVKMTWINCHPFYHLYMGLKNAFFGVPVTNPVYYICACSAVIALSAVVSAALSREMRKEG